MRLPLVLLALIASTVVGCQGDTPAAPSAPAAPAQPEFDLTIEGAVIDLSIFDMSALGDIGRLMGVESPAGGPLRGPGDPPILAAPVEPGEPPSLAPLETTVLLYLATIWLFENGHLDAPSAVSALLPDIDALNWLVADNEPNAVDSFNEFINVVQGLVADGLLDPVAGQWLIDCAQGAIDQLSAAISTAISAGETFTCALDADGHAYCWGSNHSGQLADGTLIDHGSPAAIAGGLVFTKLAAAWDFACGLTAGGQDYCWGQNSHGQLGDGSTSDHRLPAPVSGGLTFGQITASPFHACGLTTTGEAHCWGSNSSGKLGDGTTTNSSTPVAVAGSLIFAQITGGYDANCWVTVAGAAYCWGSNRWGQIGDGTMADRATPTLVVGGLAFTSLTMGDGHTCGLATGGQAYCWGANTRGQLGDGSLTWTTAPVAVAGGLTFTQLSAEFDQTCGVAIGGGTAYCWGYNADGQLGDGSTTLRTSPTAVAGNLAFTQISLGDNHTCGLVSGGGLPYCWGANGSGQIGDGTTVGRLTPTLVAWP